MEPREAGLYALSPSIEDLAYVDAMNLWPVPIAQAGLYGVLKDFWNAMFAKGQGEETLLLI